MWRTKYRFIDQANTDECSGAFSVEQGWEQRAKFARVDYVVTKGEVGIQATQVFGYVTLEASIPLIT